MTWLAFLLGFWGSLALYRALNKTESDWPVFSFIAVGVATVFTAVAIVAAGASTVLSW